MAMYYSEKIGDRKSIYDAAQKWKNQCLLNDLSLIWDNEEIWTEKNMNNFKRIFIENPDESGDSFDDKLKKQLQDEDESVYKFVIEILYMYYLYTSSISYNTKMEKLEDVASWKGIELDRSLPIFEALKDGLGSTGTFYNVQRYYEISFLFYVVENLKRLPIETRKELLSNPKQLKNFTEDIRQKNIDKKVQMLHVLLHLLLTDYFEPIASWGNKQSIVKAYSDFIPENFSSDLDDQLYIIRESLEKIYPDSKVNFYDSPFVEKWKKGKPEFNPNYFIVINDPETWKVEEIKDGSIVDFTIYNENGNRKKMPKAFEKIKKGDLVVFYESSPTLQAVAIGETVRGLHKKKVESSEVEEEIVSFKYKSDITPVSWDEIKNHDVLKENVFVRQGARGTLFELTKEQYDVLVNWDKTAEDDHLVKIPHVDFDVDSIVDGIVFENNDLLIEQVKTALSSGKHIILTGPPGTGKSKLASKICEMYRVPYKMVTATSNWSTYETIGGYRPNKNGELLFHEGIFMSCFRDKHDNKPANTWLIIDEINRADIDKAFGSLFSVLTGDEITLPFESDGGNTIVMKPQGKLQSIEPNDYTYVVPNDWRIIATMNTIDKASLYEMSYAFMRRFAFIPVPVPKNISNELIQQYLKVWDMELYPHVETLSAIWKLINNYRKIGPAIVRDIAKYTFDNDDFTSAIILYVLPQFEGLPIHRLNEFVEQIIGVTDELIDKNLLKEFVDDFFDAGGM